MKTCRDSSGGGGPCQTRRRVKRTLGPVTALAAALGPSLAHAHGALGAADDIPLVAVVVPAILAGLGAFFLFKLWQGSHGSPHLKRQKRHLEELEHALRSNLSALKYAEEYPGDHGLSAEEREQKLGAVAKIQRLIEQAKLTLDSA